MTTLLAARLALREIELGDWPAVLAYRSEPAFLRWYPLTGRPEAHVRRFVRLLVDWRRERPRIRYQWAITLRKGGRLIGTCGIRRSTPDASEADVGIELAPAFWRQGYATEAMRAVLRFGFGELRLHRLWARCLADNRAAVRLVESLGMTREGRLRETTLIRGRWHDSLIYAVLRDRWARG